MSNFFLVSKSAVIQIDEKVSIARKNGNIILENDKSKHVLTCRLDPKKTSANGKGVFVNDLELNLSSVLEMKVGDSLKIDSDEFKLYDNAEEVEKIKPRHERRRYKRPKNAYSLVNFINFYSAPPWALILYTSAFIVTVFRFFLHPPVTGPENLKFLIDYYNSNIIVKGAMMLVLVYIFSLAHSFLMYIYFNRNALRQFVISLSYIIALPVLIWWIYFPLGEAKSYLTIRHATHNPPEKNVAILSLLQSMDNKKKITSAYEFINDNLTTDENRESLKDDYLKNIDLIEKEIEGRSKD